MSKKSKTPRFNSVLEDFRKFANIKVAEGQGDKEQSIALPGSDADVVDALVAGGEPFGSNSDPLSNMGTPVGQSLPGVKRPTEETEQRKEVSPSEKIASEDESLVNDLLASISIAINEEKTAAQETPKEDGEDKTAKAKWTKKTNTEETTETTPDSIEDASDASKAKGMVVESSKKSTSKCASDEGIDEDVLASKIANHFRDVSVGYELGKYLFQTLGQKVAAEGEMPPGVAEGMAAGGAAPAPEGGGDEDEIATIMQAIQELVQEGLITEEQAQQFLVELEGAMQGGGAPEGESMPEEDMQEEQKEAMLINAINEKVAELSAEGYAPNQIAEYLKQAAQNDAKQLMAKQAEEEMAPEGGEGDEIATIMQAVQALIQEGQITEEQAQQFLSELEAAMQGDVAPEEAPVEIPEEQKEAMVNAVNEKVAELSAEGYAPDQIAEYLKQAAQNDAQRIIKNASDQKFVSDYIYEKAANAVTQGVSKAHAEEYIKYAFENQDEVVNEINSLVAIENNVTQKVAELQNVGYTEDQITQYLSEAARNDAQLVKSASQKEALKGALFDKIAEGRDPSEAQAAEAPAAEGQGGEMPEEMQQILQALEELLQSGKISEEEAVAVLKELGIGEGQ